METRLLKEINTVLAAFPEYWEGDVLLKTKLIDDLREYKKELIESLLSNHFIKKAYSLEVKYGLIFKIDEFINMLRYKNYWDNSYTRFSNEIGLTSENKYLKYNTDVVLDFPHKDCILEGGMTKEDCGKQEVYYHKVLAKDEIDIMLSPKVFTNIKKYDKNGDHKFKEDDNLIIKGNNLIALHSMKKRYAGAIKSIIIDPPYNTGGDSFRYNDRFNHSTWLTFMKNRLEVARELLAENGSIWIHIDDDEQAYLKVLCDEIFGRDNFVNNVIWEKRYSPTNDSKWLSDSHDFILVYAKNKEIWRPNLLPRSEKQNKYYKYDDGDGRGPWRSDNVLVKSFSESGVFPIKNPNTGEEFYPPKGSCYRFNKDTAEKYLAENRFYFGKDGTGAPQLKRYLSEVKQGVTPMTIWFRDDVTDNQEAKKEVRTLNSENIFSTPKPEALIQRIIHLSTNERDIVLDFFLGSGTTAAVAHKMNRQYIAIEQMNYVQDITVERLKKVIDGEQGGISKDVDWNGGGSFVYVELYELNQQYISRIRDAKSSEEIEGLIEEIKDAAFLDFKINIDRLTKEDSEFASLSLEDKKKLLIESLDANQMYLSYSEIDDAQYDIPESVKLFNHSFYQNDKAVIDHE